MSSLAEKTLQAIRKDHIVPAPFWQFRLMRGLRWLVIGLLGMSAVLVTGFAVHIVAETDWAAYKRADLLWSQAVLVSLPTLWIVLCGVLLVGGIFLFHRTSHGYRYTPMLLASLFLVMSTGLGILIELSPLDEPVENFFLGTLKHQEVLRKLVPSLEQQWSQPEYGLLGGEVIETNTTQETLELRDFEDTTWSVDYEHATLPENDITPKETVKIIGKEKPDGHFEAEEIRVWTKKSSATNQTQSVDQEKRIQGEQEEQSSEKRIEHEKSEDPEVVDKSDEDRDTEDEDNE